MLPGGSFSRVLDAGEAVSSPSSIVSSFPSIDLFLHLVPVIYKYPDPEFTSAAPREEIGKTPHPSRAFYARKDD